MTKFYLQIFVLIFTLTITSGSASYGKIKGGRAAKRGEYPFVGHLVGFTEGNNAKICGCGLVTVSKIVTAAHCVMVWEGGSRRLINLGRSQVIFGTLYLLADDGQTSFLKNIKYPNEIRKRRYGGYMHDYATAELVNPMHITDMVKPLSIYSTDKNEFKNGWDEMVASKAQCTIIGWGATSFKVVNKSIVSGGPSQFLKTTQVIPWEEQRCQDHSGPARENMVPFGQVCLLGVRHGDTSLPGDSGGPLICGDFVWGVATTITVDDTGTQPMHYLLHWHYLTEFLLPDIGKRSGGERTKDSGWFSGWFGGSKKDEGSGRRSGGGGGGSGGSRDGGGGGGGDAGGSSGGAGGAGISCSTCPEISFPLVLLTMFLIRMTYVDTNKTLRL